LLPRSAQLPTNGSKWVSGEGFGCPRILPPDRSPLQGQGLHEGNPKVASRFMGYPCDYLAPSLFAKWRGGRSLACLRESGAFDSAASESVSRRAFHGRDAPEVGAVGWQERKEVGRTVGGRDDRAPSNARVEARRLCVWREVPESKERAPTG
jgi:hypothetical protein